jgi:hypothetical protein
MSKSSRSQEHTAATQPAEPLARETKGSGEGGPIPGVANWNVTLPTAKKKETKKSSSENEQGDEPRGTMI